jgi:hypothetical protein
LLLLSASRPPPIAVSLPLHLPWFTKRTTGRSGGGRGQIGRCRSEPVSLSRGQRPDGLLGTRNARDQTDRSPTATQAGKRQWRGPVLRLARPDNALADRNKTADGKSRLSSLFPALPSHSRSQQSQERLKEISMSIAKGFFISAIIYGLLGMLI